MRQIWVALIIIALIVLVPYSQEGQASEFMIYNIYQGLNLGDANGAPKKDYFINMGSSEGLKTGSILKVYRRVSTYDTLKERLYREVTFPIATVKIIHVESHAAVARLESMLPADSTPTSSPRALMVGDLVSLSN